MRGRGLLTLLCMCKRLRRLAGKRERRGWGLGLAGAFGCVRACVEDGRGLVGLFWRRERGVGTGWNNGKEGRVAVGLESWC